MQKQSCSYSNRTYEYTAIRTRGKRKGQSQKERWISKLQNYDHNPPTTKKKDRDYFPVKTTKWSTLLIKTLNFLFFFLLGKISTIYKLIRLDTRIKISLPGQQKTENYSPFQHIRKAYNELHPKQNQAKPYNCKLIPNCMIGIYILASINFA